MRKTNAEKQRQWSERARVKREAERAELEAWRKQALHAPRGRAGAVDVTAVVEGLRDLQRVVEALHGRLTALAENEPWVRRQLVEIRRHLGLTELHQPPRHTRKRPLGLAG